MQITLTFDLPNEEEAFNAAYAGLEWREAVRDYIKALRSEGKEELFYSDVIAILYAVLDSRELKLEEV